MAKFAKKEKNNGALIAALVVLCLLLAVELCFVAYVRNMERSGAGETAPEEITAGTGETVAQTDALPETESTTEATTEPTTEATEPPIIKETTATIGATGDILLHDLLIKSGYDKSTGTYNYDEPFEFIREYVSQVDYAVANLEVTLAGDDNGYKYSGYPCFNSPDAIVDALKNAGFDMLLTANNHSYDTGSTGFTRTQEVVNASGLAHIGTRLHEEDPNYVVQDINGIRIGMINYTYNDSSASTGRISLNGNKLSATDSALINSFSYSDLDTFYSKLEGEIAQMREEGAEAIVVFIHWGTEYKTAPNSRQEKIAQALCNLGVDVIIGNHPHVVQPVEILTNENDESKTTLCLYSTGDSLTNIYGTSTFPYHTEDGILFSFTFAKYSDGTVIVEGVELLPFWVWRPYDSNGVLKFHMLPFDTEIEDWQTYLGVTDSVYKKCLQSYDRTMGVMEESMISVSEYLTANQAQVETALGVQ